MAVNLCKQEKMVGIENFYLYMLYEIFSSRCSKYESCEERGEYSFTKAMLKADVDFLYCVDCSDEHNILENCELSRRIHFQGMLVEKETQEARRFRE
jgi:hypothetical protein